MNKKLYCLLVLVLLVLVASCAPGDNFPDEETISPEEETDDMAGANEFYDGEVKLQPDRELHPGAINPQVEHLPLEEAVCKAGFSATVRPSSYHTNKIKRQQMAKEGLYGTPADYEQDHIIPLSLGGHPIDEKNLWPQPYENRGNQLAPDGYGAETKDRAENLIRRAVCEGDIPLRQAQREIATDWIKWAPR